ncbi:hypothetical protein V7793_06445 [Streptomyces sp. KLMMK]|uniref:hypothetical protein n=1 Tax=Streptomyces sp. KLMMK TaxID=3109353 RepID=UPI003000470B
MSALERVPIQHVAVPFFGRAVEGKVLRFFVARPPAGAVRPPSYLTDLMPARARIFGGSTFEDYVERCPELSLLDQGILDTPCCPLLLVNGKDDQQNASAGLCLALDHGTPRRPGCSPAATWARDPYCPPSSTG